MGEAKPEEKEILLLGSLHIEDMEQTFMHELGHAVYFEYSGLCAQMIHTEM